MNAFTVFIMRFIPKNKIVANILKVVIVAGAAAIGYSAQDVQKELCAGPMESPALKADPTPTK